MFELDVNFNDQKVLIRAQNKSVIANKKLSSADL